MSFTVGSLVRARGREWVVLPDSDDELLLLRPLGGTDDETAGILTALEPVISARFDLPDPSKLGDDRSARLLRDALRLGFRATAGPFRSFGQLGFEPRPYQLVPLLMALRLDPVRLLIADDVGTGKTASTLLVAAELLATAQARRLAVLCPPHLATQWQTEMRDKLNLDAELVLPATASRLERGLRVGETLFDRHDLTVVSTEFIKADRRRGEFLRTAPELIIVDEAHTCAFDPAGRSGRHQRHELVTALARDPARHLLLVTATPHSGKEDAFRSLLAFLDPAFAALPENLGGDANAAQRRRLAQHFVQRRRADLRVFLDDTPFPERLEREETYALSPAYRRLFQRAIAFASESIRDRRGGQHRQRVRWWSALALLRSLASSPAAAAQTLRNRAEVADTTSPEEADAVGRELVLDLGDQDATEIMDVTAGADIEQEIVGEGSELRRRLLEMARQAATLCGDADAKLLRLVDILGELLHDGYRPIVFCRYIPTADYLAAELRGRLGSGVEVVAVSGRIPSSERPALVAELAEHDRRVLVATDCLSEGINLQNHFDAVVHYDLSWNPTRHEQREGRVDRFGQPRPDVRVVTYWGADNRIDDLVLKVLLRKHKAIRSSLGISVPVPGDPNEVVEAIVEGLLLRDGSLDNPAQLSLEGMAPGELRVLQDWESAAEREQRSRTVFAQEGIKTDEVARELAAVRIAIGTLQDVRRFVTDAVVAHGGTCVGQDPLRIRLDEAPAGLRDAAGGRVELLARFQGTPSAGDVLLTRTHPFVSGLAAFVLDAALDALQDSPARRAGAMRTAAVGRLTVLLLVRYRFDLYSQHRGLTRQLLAEDAGVLAFTGDPHSPNWLAGDQAQALLAAAPSGNVSPQQAHEFVTDVLAASPTWQAALDEEAKRRAGELLDSHRRVRQSVRLRSASYRVEPHLPPDVIGVYVLLPGARS
jgi:superfamily II DNA or RNA helicase